jgi:hypothetical protein
VTRFSPPGAAAEDQRRLTCQASLQQSDGLFQAARSVSVAAAPLPIFYALSQGGRAIAAAARAAKGEQWKLNGHGIKAKALDGPLTAVSVATDQPGRPGSFVRLTELIGLPVWGRDVEVPFGELWDALPPNAPDIHALGDDHCARRCPIGVTPVNPHDHIHTLAVAMLSGLPAWLAEEPNPAAASPRPETSQTRSLPSADESRKSIPWQSTTRPLLRLSRGPAQGRSLFRLRRR